MMTWSVRIPGRKKSLITERPFELPLPPGGRPLTLGDLLSFLVRDEVRAFGERQESRQVLRALTEREIEEGASVGRIHPGGLEERQVVDEEEAMRTALQAFDDGLFMVFVDQVRMDSLDREIPLTPHSAILLVRLVALAGG